MPVPMVGRAVALEELRHAWERARGGGRCVPAVVTGLPGTGKSTLAAAAVQVATPEVTLAGSARLHSPAPYDWLAAVLATIGPRPDLPVPPDALAWLAQDPDVPRERYTPDALLRLAVTTVRGLVGGRPAVLVVEDLHALDPASLNLIAELAGADLPALLLVTSRPPEAAVNPALTVRTLERLAGSPGAVRRHLGPLCAGDVQKILDHVYGGSSPSREVAEAAWRRTGGNPYRLTELLAVAGDPEQLTGELREPVELTAREREVLGCLAEGRSNKQIAGALGISVRTVTVHVSNLLRKTGAASRTEAALWAVHPVRPPHRHPRTD
ncbi:LuxR C-terminal-related transcriptional regulator [Couchioplanes caeruleus]|uniref:helix-turn-helix transcriptional regulator n=1 Tax=Couchioplanes caeruleus TaxID=56438 RepID=UPI00201BE8DD|nr:LuxR family transcriptional regulator [Couchioplanes caeruleus]UQU68557.1 LuxR C-terminal-related transcriptional regulator [Couchioplanes caeruleus]